MNLLQQLEAISERRDDGGLLHGGHIHFIQNDALDGEFVLKAAIYGILEAVPDRIPLNLPEMVDAQEYEPWEEKKDHAPWKAVGELLEKLNEGLLIPLGGAETAAIVRSARKYIDLAKTDQTGAHS